MQAKARDAPAKSGRRYFSPDPVLVGYLYETMERLPLLDQAACLLCC